MSLIVIIILLTILFYILVQHSQPGKNRVTVVVVGDMGHSPRTSNHVTCLANHKINVDFLGYLESPLPDIMLKTSNIKIHKLFGLPNIINKWPLMLRYAFKFVFQSLTLIFFLIFKLQKSKIILVQNPPAIPVLMIAKFASYIRGAELCVDWHNYAYSIMKLKLGNSNLLTKFSYYYEHLMSSVINKSFCVTRAMEQDLAINWSVIATPLYDKPNPLIFNGRVSIKKAHDLFERLSDDYPIFKCETDSPSCTTLTEKRGSVYHWRDNKPFLIVSSTSWTEDEDFSLLLSALTDYEGKIELLNLPNVICVITGKGPLKSYYEDKLKKTPLKHVTILTVWLSIEDYACLLGAADIGVCLHTSSSGLDLPMKIVDMFGSELPVCAVSYKCIHELVVHGDNGFIYTTSQELGLQLIRIACDMKVIERCRKYIAKDRIKHSWQNEWMKYALPYFNRKSKPTTLYIARLSLILFILTISIWFINISGLGFIFDLLIVDDGIY